MTAVQTLDLVRDVETIKAQLADIAAGLDQLAERLKAVDIDTEWSDPR